MGGEQGGDGMLIKNVDFEPVINEIERHISRLDEGSRVLVALSGVPGSGKTTLAAALSAALNGSRGPAFSTAIPMDGYHYSKEDLRKFPNPDKAFERRGAHWTFDADSCYADLSLARKRNRCVFPAFDHAAGDPEHGAITVEPECRVLIVEGNYLLFDRLQRWANVKDQFDIRVFLECDEGVAIDRLANRHMAAWNIPRQKALERAQGSDYLNALLIRTTKVAADIVLTG